MASRARNPRHSQPGEGRVVRRAMHLSTLDGLFAVQYATLTSGTLLTAWLLELGASAFHVGVVAALPLLGGLLQPAGAEVVRRRGGWRKRVCLQAALVDVLLWGVSLGAVAVLGAARALPVVLVVLATQQAANAFVGVAWTSWISDLIPPSLRGRYFGRRNFVCNAFGAVTAVLAGQLIHRADDALPLFAFAITAGVASRCISIYHLYRQPEPQPASSIGGGLLQQLRAPLAHRAFRRFVTYGMAWGFAVQLVSPFFTVYMLEQVHVGVGTVMLFAALGTIANLVGQRVWGPLCDRYGDRQVLRLVALVIALQPLWWCFTGRTGPGFYLMGLLNVVGGFAWSGQALATGNLMMRLAPETGKTAFFAVQAALGGLFGALGPLVGGVAASMLSGAAATGTFLDGLKILFLGSAALRLGAWALLHRVPEPTTRPRQRTIYLIRDVIRTFNPAQGFSPLLHVFVPARRRRSQ